MATETQKDFLNTLSDNDLSDLTTLDESGVATDDFILVYDVSANVFVKMTIDNLQDEIDTVGSGSAFSVSDITGATALTSGLASTDELVLSDDGTLKRMDVSVIQAYMQANLTFTTDTRQLTTFQLEDTAGTEVTISHGKEVKLIGGTGISTSWSDTSHGTDGDPYDMTIALDITNATDADSVLTIDGDGTLTAESDLQFNETNGLVVRTNRGIRLNNADDDRNSRLYNSGASSYSNIDFWTGNNTTPRKVVSINHLGNLTMGHDGTNKTYVFPKDNTGASAGDVLAFPSSGYELEFVAQTDTNTNQLTTFTLTADSGSPNQTIAHGNILNIAGGDAITTVVGNTDTVTINHDDTSSQASVNNSGRTYIQDITLDPYGHVTAISSATETVTNTDTVRTVTAGGNTLATSETLAFTAGTNVTISESGGAVTIASTDTNTQLSQENVEDYVNGLIVAGSNITKTYDDSAGTLTLASTDTNTQLTQEQVEDFVAGVVTAGANITKTYDDAAGTLTIASTDTNTQLSDAQVISALNSDLGGDKTFGTQTDDNIKFGGTISLSNISGASTYDLTIGGATPSVLLKSTDAANEAGDTIGSYLFFNNDYSSGQTGKRIAGGMRWTASDVYGRGHLELTSGNSNPQSTYNSTENVTDTSIVRLKINSDTGKTTFNEAFTFPAADGSANQVLRTNGSGTVTWENQTDTNTQLSQEQVEDYVNGVIVGGTNVTATYDDSAGTLTLSSTDTNTTYSAGTGLALSTTTFSLDIDGLTDIGESINDADLLIIDNGANGTTRKTTMARVATWIGDNVSEVRLRDARNEGPSTSTEMRPTDFSDKSAVFTFTDDITSSTNSWDSVLTMKGWSDNYRAWQIFSASDHSTNSVDTEPLYFRSGEADVGTSLTSDDGGWGVRREILTFPGTTPNSDGNANQVLITNGSGALSWGDQAGASGEANQNAFSNVAVSGQSNIAADSKTDTLNFAAGSNITLTTNATSDTLTITASDTNTQLSTEAVQDIVGAMFSSNTETRITAEYIDGGVGAGKINLVVDDMTADTNTTYSAGSGLNLSTTTFSVDVSDFMSNGVNNRVLTATGTDAMNAEGNLTFDGGRLSIIPGNNEFGIVTGSNVTASSVTNGTRKFSRIGFPHVDSGSQPPVILMVGDSDTSGNNKVKVGGGTNQGNAATVVEMYAAGDNTTTTGDLIADFTEEGLRIGSGSRVTTILDQDNMSSNSATALATQQSIKAYVDANAGGGGSDTNTFVIVGEESDDYISTTAGAGNANGYVFSYGNGAQNTTKSSSGNDFGVVIPVACTLSRIDITFGNKGSETNSSNQDLTIYKNGSATTSKVTYNASGTGGNKFVKSFSSLSGDGLSYAAGNTFNLRATLLSGYGNTQVGPARMTAYFTVA